jgi:HEAT repeat protein
MYWKAFWVLLMMVFPFVSGCSKECKPGEDVDCWISALKNPEMVSKAIDSVRKIDDKKAEPALIDLFQASAEDPETRENIAEIFRKWETKAAVKPMVDALDFSVGADKDGKKAKRTNRANEKIASALGSMGDPAAIQPLLRLLKSTKEGTVQRASIRALGKLKAKDATEDLLQLFEDTTVHHVVRMNSVFALGEIGDDRAIPSLVLALYRDKAAFYSQAQLALVRIGEPAVDLLVKTMTGENQAAKQIVESNMQVIQGALEANAAQVLGEIASPLAVEPLLQMAEKISKWEDRSNRLLVIVRIINALGMIGDKRGEKLIVKHLQEEEWDVRTICVTALNYIGDRSVLPDIINNIGKGVHPQARIPLIEAVGNLGTDEQLPKLKEIQEKDKDIEVQKMLPGAIKRLEAYAQCKQDVNCWIGKLSSNEAEVREKAAYELGRIGNEAAVGALIKIVNDSSENVRFALIWAFDHLKSKKPIDAIEELLEKEKGGATTGKVNYNYQLLIARLNRVGK